jgi:hypothetical protein
VKLPENVVETLRREIKNAEERVAWERNRVNQIRADIAAAELLLNEHQGRLMVDAIDLEAWKRLLEDGK